MKDGGFVVLREPIPEDGERSPKPISRVFQVRESAGTLSANWRARAVPTVTLRAWARKWKRKASGQRACESAPNA